MPKRFHRVQTTVQYGESTPGSEHADTDVALISGEDLNWVAKNWGSLLENGKFDLDVFNYTGVLDRNRLRKRMKIFLK